jgi:hypothetical protein
MRDLAEAARKLVEAVDSHDCPTCEFCEDDPQDDLCLIHQAADDVRYHLDNITFPSPSAAPGPLEIPFPEKP